jgi:hypothetical protein
MTSIFASYQTKAWPFRFAGTLHVATIAGGVPTDDKVAEAWLRTKLADKDDLIREAVAKTMVERGIGAEEAAAEVDSLKHLNGFKRDEVGLYIEGRQLKAALKEAVNVAANAGKITSKGWGNPDNANYKKGIKAWFPEHVFVLEDRLHLGVTEPTGIVQRFVHTPRGTGIQYEEYVEDAKVSFTVVSDHEFTAEQWAMIWLTGEQQGIGASRSQGFGRYEVTDWERIPAPAS